MRITRVRWAPYRIPFRAPYVTSRGTATHRRGYILAIETGGGIQGLGEASLDPSAPSGIESSVAIYLEFIARSILDVTRGEADRKLESYLAGDQASRAAHCAFETAIADADCRSLGIPMAQFFTGDPESPPARRPEHYVVTVNALVGSRATDDAVKAAVAAVRRGFSCIKLKVGMERTTQAEVDRVRAVREAIGADVKLRLDANGAWAEAEAIERIRAFEPFDIEVVEQPVPADALDGLAAVSERVNTVVAADEAAASTLAAEEAIGRGIPLILKPMRLGGPTVVRYLADAAKLFGLGCVVTTTIDSGIATAMALQVAAALPDDDLAHGLATLDLLEDDLILEPALPIESGRMRLPDAPGLGVALDEEALMRYSEGWREINL